MSYFEDDGVDGTSRVLWCYIMSYMMLDSFYYILKTLACITGFQTVVVIAGSGANISQIEKSATSQTATSNVVSVWVYFSLELSKYNNN